MNRLTKFLLRKELTRAARQSILIADSGGEGEPHWILLRIDYAARATHANLYPDYGSAWRAKYEFDEYGVV